MSKNRIRSMLPLVVSIALSGAALFSSLAATNAAGEDVVVSAQGITVEVAFEEEMTARAFMMANKELAVKGETVYKKRFIDAGTGEACSPVVLIKDKRAVVMEITTGEGQMFYVGAEGEVDVTVESVTPIQII